MNGDYTERLPQEGQCQDEGKNKSFKFTASVCFDTDETDWTDWTDLFAAYGGFSRPKSVKSVESVQSVSIIIVP